jgi:CheY-like chemotaxis protein
MSNVIYLAARDQPASLLLVERDPLLRIEVAAHLRKAGLSVLEAVNGEEVLALLRAGRSIHLVLGRLQGEGSGLTAAVQRDFPQVKLFDCSATNTSKIPQSGTSETRLSHDLAALEMAIKDMIGGMDVSN